MSEEVNPYRQGTYAHAAWNLHKAQRALGITMAQAIANWQRNLEAQRKARRWRGFSDDELEMIVSWKQSLDAAVRMGSHRYEPDDSFGEAIEAELERRRVSDREAGGSS